MPQRLPRDFYARHVVTVAQELLGKRLFFKGFSGIITETEAYRGADDAASHAVTMTPRSCIMFGPPGYSYVYMIYGIHHCLNIVAEEDGQPGAVLIRGLYSDGVHIQGPGKLCKKIGITQQHNGLTLLEGADFYVSEGPALAFTATPRIGIKKAVDTLWRFVADKNI